MARAARRSVPLNIMCSMKCEMPSSSPGSSRAPLRTQTPRASERRSVGIMAAGTGATLFQNNNDLDAGFARLVSAPEYYYLLAFSPQNLKMDGSFHPLKVTLKNVKDVNVGARTGYYAPRHLENAIETAKREIEEALFSRLRNLFNLEVDVVFYDLTSSYFEGAGPVHLFAYDLLDLAQRAQPERQEGV